MGAGRVGERRAAKVGLATWAAVVLALTLVFAIGGPLIGRGTFIGTTIMRAELPWQLSTPSTFQYKLPPVYDTVEIGTPARTLIRETLVNDHRVALWDPFANGGTPLGSQPGTGIFSPLNWPLLLLGVRLGSAWAGLFRLALAAGGTFLLLRRLGLSRFAGICGGLIYCASGFIVSWNNWPQADLAAWIPLLFFTADRLRERRRVLDVAAVAAVVGAMLLEGYPPLVLATFYALGGFLLVRWWEADRADREGPSFATRIRSALKPASLLIGGVALGVGLAAFQLLPFLMRVSVYDTSYRATSGERKFPASALLTSVFPWAQGSPAHHGTGFAVDHVNNFSLTEQFVFLGAAAVVFVLFALLVGPPKRVGAGVYWYCAAIVALLLVMLFGAHMSPLPNLAGGLKAVLYKVPGVSQIPLHRFVAPLLFFATLLAAFGIEQVISSDRSILRVSRRLLVRGGILFAFSAYMIIPAVRNEIQMTRWTKTDLYFGVTREVAQRAFILKSTIVPMLIVVATVLVIVFALRASGSVRRVAIGAIPVLLAFEALIVTTTMFPRVADADYYPETGAIRYLSAHLGHERIAPAGRMLYFGTNAIYGLRSVGGHSFSPPEWRKLINKAGEAENTPTQLRLSGGKLGVAQSPVLDRLAARFWVSSPYDPVFGIAVAAPAPAGAAVAVGNGNTASQVVDPGPLRGVIVNVLGKHRLRGSLDFLDVKVRDPAGRIVATGRRRLISQSSTTSYVVAIPGDRLPSDVPWTVEIAVRSDGRDRAWLAATADGKVSLGVVRPQADGLRLVYADEGAVVYRRLTALPRIRWASRSKTIPGPRVRTNKLLTGAVADDTVVLNRHGPVGSGRPARVVVTKDSGDQIRAEVNAQGNGYLVVADAIQDDWRATVDGRPVDLRDADHALVAIPVRAGRHVVAVSAAPRGWHAGILVSLIAAIILAVLCAWGLVHRRRSGARTAALEAELPAPAPDSQGMSAKVDSK